MYRAFKGITRRSKNFSPSMINKIFERDDGTCIYCGSPAQDIDHVIPLSAGGITHPSNGVCSCHSCNCKKSKHPDNIDTLTRAIFWLSTKGEDTSWMDKL